jgi:protein-S-isoprenylcysteine O-methyltransferase Ste14
LIVTFLQDAVVGCWLVFLAFWAIAALRTKRTAQTLPLVSRLSYALPTLLGAGLIFKGASAPHPLGDRVLQHDAIVAAFGLAIALAGLALALWARVTLGGNWSGQVTFKEGHELVRHGPYAHVRHPIYSAILLMLLGTAISIGTLGALFGLPLIGAGIWLKIGQEEALMSEHFPDEYAAYRSRVKALVPRLL